jgi:hypothetical protein
MRKFVRILPGRAGNAQRRRGRRDRARWHQVGGGGWAQQLLAVEMFA